MADQVGIVKKIETIAPGLLSPSAYNPRTISPQEFAKLRRSLREFGFVEPVVVNNGNKIIGGHQRVRAAIEEGLKRVPIVRLDLPETKAKALNLALNRITGEWDVPLLKELLDQLEAAPDFDIEITGFDPGEIEQMTAQLSTNSAEPEKVDPAEVADAAAELQRKWQVKFGQFWRIPSTAYRGKVHTVLCGDCLKHNGLNGHRADMVFTDPPWNVALGSDSQISKRRRNENKFGKSHYKDDLPLKDYADFIRRSCQMVTANSTGDIYFCMASIHWSLLTEGMRSAGCHCSAVIVWLKDIPILSRSKYMSRYEAFWYGWAAKNKSTFRGKNDQNVWECPRPRSSTRHPAMKPVELPYRAICNSSRRGALVYDPFLGSGSSMVAAEQAGRVCAGVEIEPKFVAVVLERMANLGLKPRLAK